MELCRENVIEWPEIFLLCFLGCFFVVCTCFLGVFY